MRKIVFILLFFSILIKSQENGNSFTLQEAIEHSLQNNYQIELADLEIEKAKKQIWEATATGLPHIDGNVQYNYNLDIPVAFFNDKVIPLGSRQSLAATVEAKQLVFSGTYFVGLQSAKAFGQISNLSKEKVETQLKEIVTNAYAAVVIADENIKIIDKNLEVSRKNLEDTNEIYKAGFIEEQAVDQLNFTFTQLEANYNFANRNLQRAKNTLKYVIGVPQEEEIVAVTTLEELMIDQLALEAVESGENAENHIDFRIADHQVTINELQVKYQKTFAIPTINTFFNHSQNNFSESGVLFSGFNNFVPSTVWGLTMNIPIFSSLERSARTQQAKIDLEKAEVERNNILEELTQNIKNAQIDYENALDNYYTAQELVELSRKIFGKEQIKFFEGMSTSTDLAEVEKQLYESDAQYIQSIFEVIQAKTKLYQALGKY